MSVSRQHADWLSLVESSGPFLSLPVLMRVFPQGLDRRDPEQAKQLRLAYEEWQENPKFAGKQHAWIMFVLQQGLEYPAEMLTEGQTLPPGLSVTMAEYGETLRPDLALVGPAGSKLAGKAQLLITIYPPDQALDKPVTGKHWKASPGTRMMELLHASDVPLGLVTNGEQWMLVFAPRSETTGFTSWFAALWIDEPLTLRAFLALLAVRRFFGVAPTDTLLALLKESAQDQQEVTNQLGDQVRDAVEVLIQAFDRLDQDSGRMLLKGVDEKNLYDAALTVMMRLVFLFSAEERSLLHLGKPIYDDNYAVSTLREQLQEVADQYGEEVLERRHDAWARLLATFRAVHGGVGHQDLMLPAYGGSLFDPDRYPFLEGRPQGSRWQSKPAEPLEINNRVVLHLLKSLQMLQVRVPGGGPAEARRISFRALDIEQIGHIYEGLLDHTAVRAKEVVLGLTASRKKPVASMALTELEKLRQEDGDKLIELLEEETGRSAKALQRALENGDSESFHKILMACGQDQKLADRVVEFGGLLKQDSFDRPVIVLPGGIYVGQGSARRSTGTHYTPRSLTEPIVQYTLEPLVYQGPAEGLPKEQWRLKSPKEILDLKVCDIAMGSGAFLVQSCRYLSERLVESWENLEKEHPGEFLTTPEGQFSKGEPSERLIPKEAAERLAIARRIVADRCIYGVDINPMAVEMAKLSIWLITVDKTRPFTFLDHALKCGDSLLGICRFKQLETFSLDDEHTKQVIILANYHDLIRTAITKRRELEVLPSNDTAQIAAKEGLLAEAEGRIEQLKLAADLLIGAELTEGTEQKRAMARAASHMKVTEYMHKPVSEFRRFCDDQTEGRRPFHWPLEFPEIFACDGFDGFIYNPPFRSGSRISSDTSEAYFRFIKRQFPMSKGNTDLCCYFIKRSAELTNRSRSTIGFLATNSINQGDNRISTLVPLLTDGWRIRSALPDAIWPGTANLYVSWLVLSQRAFDRSKPILNGHEVSVIDSNLADAPEAPECYPLKSNQELCFKGIQFLGDGFKLDPETAAELRAKFSDSGIVRPWLNGADLTDSHELPLRYAIDFGDRSLDEARQFKECIDIVERDVRPVREQDNREAYRKRWWLFAERAVGLQSALRMLAFVLARPFTSDTFFFERVRTDFIFTNALVVVCLDNFAAFSILNSALHETWARQYGSGMKMDLRYTPSKCFASFPFPAGVLERNSQYSDDLASIGLRYYDWRFGLKKLFKAGITDIYNRFHDRDNHSSEISQLRVLHMEMDRAVANAYNWSDLDLGHGFRETKRGIQFTICESARRIILDRLLRLNHQRHQQEPCSLVGDANILAEHGSAKSKAKKVAAQGELL